MSNADSDFHAISTSEVSSVVKRMLSCAVLLIAFSAVRTSFASSSQEAEGAVPSDGSAVSVNPVVEWNRSLLVILRTPGAQPASIHSTRSFAMMHAAIFDAVNSIEKTYTPYAVRLSHVTRSASAEAAADQAAHDVLVSLYPTFTAALDSELQRDLEQIRDGRRKEEGIGIGEAVAAEILALRAGDGSDVSLPAFVPTTRPGSYQLTPPNFAPADFLQWSRVTPFAIASASEFRPAPPPELTSDAYTQSFDEVKSLGLITSATRTTDQTEIGKFWNGNIQDFWNEIAQTAALEHHLDLAQSAHLFALMNIGVADTVIAFFDAKYTYDLWRPVSAIQLAGTDNNPQTDPDPTWIPLSTKTAPDPSYPGAHSAVSFAASRVLQSELGDQIELNVTSESLAGVTRHFTSFSGAAEEAGLSRIYAGQHFRFDHIAGLTLGRQVADSVISAILMRHSEFDQDD
jgi:PAP2 superfamily